jgi:hypothetical protein
MFIAKLETEGPNFSRVSINDTAGPNGTRLQDGYPPWYRASRPTSAPFWSLKNALWTDTEP